jgi:hypothetical protein
MDDIAYDEQQETIGNEESPLTSVATDPQTAQGTVFRACRCPEHQDIYNNWPTQNANLNIVGCMKICPYCGKDCHSTTNLRKHIVRREYKGNNLTINTGKPGRQPLINVPSWTDRQPEPQTSQQNLSASNPSASNPSASNPSASIPISTSNP